MCRDVTDEFATEFNAEFDLTEEKSPGCEYAQFQKELRRLMHIAVKKEMFEAVRGLADAYREVGFARDSRQDDDEANHHWHPYYI